MTLSKACRLDGTIVADEAIESIWRSNKGVILCKLDIEKANIIMWIDLSLLGYGEGGF